MIHLQQFMVGTHQIFVSCIDEPSSIVRSTQLPNDEGKLKINSRTTPTSFVFKKRGEKKAKWGLVKSIVVEERIVETKIAYNKIPDSPPHTPFLCVEKENS
jgi:hypothetical protein